MKIKLMISNGCFYMPLKKELRELLELDNDREIDLKLKDNKIIVSKIKEAKK
ncbi:MAG: hypothetical protein ACFFDH_00650 [Promethearchaeota archaeon]